MSSVIILTSLLFINICYAYPDPECQGLRGTPSTQILPFDLQVILNSPDAFNQNYTVTAIIRGTSRAFRDFLIQAKIPYGQGNFQSNQQSSFSGQGFQSGFSQVNVGVGNVIGSWATMASDSRVINCQGFSDTIINSNRDSKQSVTAKWNAPRGYVGQVQIVFSVVSLDDQLWDQQIKTIDIPQQNLYSQGQGQGQFFPGQGQFGSQQQGQWGQQSGQWGQQPGQWGQQPGQWGQQPGQYPQGQSGQYDPWNQMNNQGHPGYSWSSSGIPSTSSYDPNGYSNYDKPSVYYSYGYNAAKKSSVTSLLIILSMLIYCCVHFF